MLSNHLILHRPLLLLPSIFPSIKVFPNESVLCIRWPKYWSYSFRISLSMNIQSPSAVILEPKKIRFATVSTFLLSICHEVTGPVAKILVLWMLSFNTAFSLFSFTLLFHTQEALQFLFAFCHYDSIICVSEVAAISPSNHDSSLCSSSLAFHMMYFACKLNKQGDNTHPWHTSFPISDQSIVLCLVLTVASWPAYRFLKRQVRWSGISISLRVLHSLLWFTLC